MRTANARKRGIVIPMETTKTTAKDFFLWLGALVALYTTATALISLLFEYINYTYPDPLAGYGDPYGSTMRLSMALLIVGTPAMLILFRLIRKSIDADPARLTLWIRRWGLMLTLFVASLVTLIDLVTLINTFLGGEITVRFALKVLVVLLVAGGIFLHILADLRGYWQGNRDKARYVTIGVAIVVIASIVASFFVIGSPAHMRDLRYDNQRVMDLSQIQGQVVSYYQQKRELPANLDELNDPLLYFSLPVDPESAAPYEYSAEGLTFTLCAVFAVESPDMEGKGAYGRDGITTDVAYPSMYGLGPQENQWEHGTGRTCFTRTIDPEKFPANPTPKPI